MAVLTVCACSFAAAACSSSNNASIPKPSAEVAGYCAKLHANLPERLDGMPRKNPQPSSDLTAGWGGLVVLRCGVPQPSEDRDSFGDAGEINGVTWSYAELKDGSARLTTTLRKAYVEVVLRGKYAHDASLLMELAPSIKATIPEGIA